MARKRSRGLSPDDKAIWERVTQTVAPIHTPKSVDDVGGDPAPSKPVPHRKTPLFTEPLFRRPATETAVPKTSYSLDLAADPIKALLEAPAALDRRNFDRFKRGKLEPERRLDLHGRTLAQAERALRSFILSARADGCRVVLVITGKGRSVPVDEGPIPQRAGAIRYNVPRWLSSLPLSTEVVQVLPAQLRHGGDGAFYVYLKQKRKASGGRG